MTELFVIRLGASPSAPAEWAAFAAGALIEAGASPDLASVAEPLGRFSPGRVIAVLQAEQATMRRLQAPPRDAKRLRAAAELLLEDELGLGTEELHMVIGKAGDAGAPVFAVDLGIMRAFHEAFEAAGMTIDQLTIDAAVLSPSAPSVIVERDRVFGTAADGIFGAERALFDVIAPKLFGDADVVVVHGPDDLPEPLRARAIERRGGGGSAEIFELLAANADAAVNLLDGPFRVRRRASLDLRSWRRTGALAAGLAGALLLLSALDSMRAGRIAGRYEAAAQSLHAAAFPQAAGADLRAHARQVLAGGASASFVTMADQVAAAVAEIDGLEIDRIRYDAARGSFSVSVRSATDADIEKFRNALRSRRLVGADAGGYRRVGESWVGEMSVSVQ